MCVALRALDAVVHVRSRRGARDHPFADFHRLPGERPTSTARCSRAS
jgi:xanthine dehydrogenase YagS FAD-binding subunit